MFVYDFIDSNYIRWVPILHWASVNSSEAGLVTGHHIFMTIDAQFPTVLKCFANLHCSR
jgi:hypothetical protein